MRSLRTLYLLALGSLLIGMDCIWMSFASLGATWLTFFGGALVSAVGTGLINGQTSNIGISTVPRERAGIAGVDGGMERARE